MGKTITPNKGKSPLHKAPHSSKSKATPRDSSSKKLASSVKSKRTVAPPPPPILSPTGILSSKSLIEHYAFIDLQVRKDTLVNPQSDEGVWRVNVGDLACIQVQKKEDGNYPPGRVERPPYTVQWRPCQILTLFQSRESKNHEWKLKAEVRWFYRMADLDRRNREFLKSTGCSKDELFESDHVAVVDACLLLGRLEVRGVEDINDDVVGPSARHLCYRFYLHKQQDVLQLFDGNIVTRGMGYSQQLQEHESVQKKTFKFLKLPVPTKQNQGNSKDQNMLNLPPHSLHVTYKKDETKTFYSSCFLTHPWSMLSNSNLICPLERRGKFPKWELCVGDVIAVPCESFEPPSGVDVIKGRNKWYPYSKPWSHAQVIAIYRHGISKHALCNEKEMTTAFASEVHLRIRWLYRVSEALTLAKEKPKKVKEYQMIERDSNRTTEHILEGKVDLSEIDCESILGPVRIDNVSKKSGKKNNGISCEDSSPVSIFMVQNRRVLEVPTQSSTSSLLCRGLDASDMFKKTSGHRKQYEESIVLARKKRAEKMGLLTTVPASGAAKKYTVGDSARVTRAGVDNSGLKSLPQKRLFDDKSLAETPSQSAKKSRGSKGASSLKAHATSQSEGTSPVSVTRRVFCKSKPFHVDVSSLKSFYQEIQIKPPLDSYDDTFRSKIKSVERKKPWVVKMGDIVTLEYETDDKAVPGSHYPFNVAWSPVEIVSIYRVHKTKDDCLKLREASQKDSEGDAFDIDADHNSEDVRLEVRWFYGTDEIPGAGKSNARNESETGLDEVFETDHLDFCSAESILSPVEIHANQCPADELNDVADGLPCVHFHCSRSWSIHRKSFVPRGPESSRAERGRMHSGFFGKHGTAKAALSRIADAASSNNVPPSANASPADLPWQEAFQSAIKTLSLAEAADVQLLGKELACRDQERSKIFDFLKTAIRGTPMWANSQGHLANNTTASSMFIAGPPGTGKTATVRSVITELQEHQSSGKVPEFKFIELNGMEMRSPFDAYVKFWEAISGIKKERLPLGKAAANLDNYFTEDSDEYGEYEDDIARKPVTVLLLDEVDYLVTDKETVLYSFFDWPLRAVPTAKLIVVGISNTINLPDRLSPKLNSRMGKKRIIFGAYTASEMQTIIKKRLGMIDNAHDPTNDVFDIDAIRFAATKAANRAGDIRKAFQICRVAAERVFEANIAVNGESKDKLRPIVGTEDVSKACRDMFHSTIYKAISYSTNYEALLLISVGALMKLGKKDAGNVQDIRQKMESISDASGERRYDARLAWSDVLYMVTRLSESGILRMTYPYMANPFPLVSTNLSPSEIRVAFRNTSHAALANKNLSEDGFDF